MSRRLRKKGDLRSISSGLPTRELGFSRFRRHSVAGRVLTLTTYLPRPVAIKARREIYTYPYPKQVRLKGRTIRLSLRRSKRPMVKTKVRVRIPERLPIAKPSYVWLSSLGVLNIGSRNKLEKINARERNVRRYSEYKGNYRKARYGQLDSRGSERFGSVAEAHRRGDSIDKIAEAALVARAISQRR